MTTPRRILGIDPGLAITGYGVLEFSPARPILCEAGVIRTADDEATEEALADTDQKPLEYHHKEEHNNGTRR